MAGHRLSNEMAAHFFLEDVIHPLYPGCWDAVNVGSHDQLIDFWSLYDLHLGIRVSKLLAAISCFYNECKLAKSSLGSSVSLTLYLAIASIMCCDLDTQTHTINNRRLEACKSLAIWYFWSSYLLMCLSVAGLMMSMLISPKAGDTVPVYCRKRVL